MTVNSVPSIPNPSFSITVRVKLENTPGALGRVMTAVGQGGGDIGAVDIVSVSKDATIRDITIDPPSSEQGDALVETIKALPGTQVLSVSDRTFLIHLGGKIEVTSKVPLRTRADLSMAYTPGVARVCLAIHEDPAKAAVLTIKKNTVAVVSDGTAVLGLGDIGPAAAMPVMEGKAMLFKEFAGIDAFPLCLDTTDTEEIIRVVKAIAPTFGGINLEDIAAPRCFEIEERLRKELDIPVFHDDQHGTAVVVLAGLINALKIVGRRFEDIKVVIAGIGAAGVACAKILAAAGVRNIVGCDRQGVVHRGRREGMNWMKEWYAEHTNPNGEQGSIHDAMRGADVFLGLAAPGVITLDDVKHMAAQPIVFAMANPTPEIMPEEAGAHVAIMATGRSDYPNQINNVLCFPGIFRGALDCRAVEINEEMKLAAAQAIAGIISEDELLADYIIPSVFDKRVVEAVARAVEDVAYRTGVAKRQRIAD